jgi:hypothetical protein
VVVWFQDRNRDVLDEWEEDDGNGDFVKIEIYIVSDEAKDAITQVDREFIKAWKKGFTEHEAKRIALARVNGVKS